MDDTTSGRMAVTLTFHIVPLSHESNIVVIRATSGWVCSTSLHAFGVRSEL
ncbi:hypothetical protein BgiBS90_000037, partial [Biomphalaria glabrata]